MTINNVKHSNYIVLRHKGLLKAFALLSLCVYVLCYVLHVVLPSLSMGQKCTEQQQQQQSLQPDSSSFALLSLRRRLKAPEPGAPLNRRPRGLTDKASVS